MIKDKKVCKLLLDWAKYNGTESVKAYNLIFDHGGICIENALVRFYDPRLRTNIDIWFKTKAPTFEQEHEYTINDLCGDE